MRSQRRYSDARVDRLPDLLATAQARGLYRTSRCEVEGREMTGPSKMLAGELWAYAFPVLKAVLRDGLVVRELQQLGVPAPALTSEQSEAITATEYHRDDLAGTMIEHALPRFLERVVTKNKWDPTRSALTTHFVNACLLAYPDVLRRWARDRLELTSTIDEAGLKAMRLDTELVIQNREAVRSIVTRAPEGIRPILAWSWLGYSTTEIAEKLELNPSTVRSRLFEFRKKKVLPLIRSGRLIPPVGYALQSPHLSLGGPR
jgi:hypothetical protein